MTRTTHGRTRRSRTSARTSARTGARTAPVRSVVLALAVVLAGLVAVAAPASARSGDDDEDREVIRVGSCTGRTDWKLKVKTDDGRLEVEGEVDSSRTGQRWRWTLKHNGSVSYRGRATTSGSSGSFDVERTIVDLAGVDRIDFVARRDGERCSGTVSF